MKVLQELQVLDQELNEMKRKSQELEVEKASVTSDLDRLQDMVDSLTSEMDALSGERSELREGLEREKENVVKAEGRLPSIKTQKEYVAVLKEIDTAKKLNKELDDRIREKDAEIDVLSRDREEKEGELASLKEKVSSRQNEIAELLDNNLVGMTERGEGRKGLLKQLPSSVQKRYQLLLDRRGGVAVVEARRGTCSGCNMNLPPQMYNSLYKTDEIQTCPHCNRLLFVTFEDV